MDLEAKHIYPGLYNLTRTYFDQDCEFYGETVDEIVSLFRDENALSFVQQTMQDIRAFLDSHAQDDRELTASFEQEFRPETNFYEWEGRSTREALVHILSILERPTQPR